VPQCSSRNARYVWRAEKTFWVHEHGKCAYFQKNMMSCCGASSDELNDTAKINGVTTI
jgi:Zn-finger protein